MRVILILAMLLLAGCGRYYVYTNRAQGKAKHRMEHVQRHNERTRRRH